MVPLCVKKNCAGARLVPMSELEGQALGVVFGGGGASTVNVAGRPMRTYRPRIGQDLACTRQHRRETAKNPSCPVKNEEPG